jgi:SAM-dependent methyltransferase
MTSANETTRIDTAWAGSGEPAQFAARKRANRVAADEAAPQRDAWMRRNAYFYEEDYRYYRFLVPDGRRILDLGCGQGHLLAALNPSQGVGVDFSAAMLEQARGNFPDLEFLDGDIEESGSIEELSGTFDIVLLSDTIGSLADCQSTLEQLHRFCRPGTRIVIGYYSPLWEPLFELCARLGLKQMTNPQNWFSFTNVENLLYLAGFEIVKHEWRLLSPKRLGGLGRLINRYLAPLPLIRTLCLRNYVVARLRPTPLGELSATVVIPCRNERGNIEAAVRRLPEFCPDLEILFVEGGSSDGTWEEIQRVIAACPDRHIRAFRQNGRGKGDAVRLGFEKAAGDVLIILDADLTVPPEDIPKFYRALVVGNGEFINGTRLVYPLENEAMRTLNYFANRLFALTFSYLLNQRFTDTLCGTKALLKRDYQAIANNRSYFGDFDPFGDFDLIFGASKLNLKVAEVPIRYQARAYGETQIARFSHGWLLLRMCIYAYAKLKAL